MDMVAMSVTMVLSTGPATKTGDVRSRTLKFVTTFGAGRQNSERHYT